MAGSLGEHVFVVQLASLRGEPRYEAERVTEALPGEPLRVEEERGGWVRVRTAYDYQGWVRAESLGGDPDPGWLDRSAADPVAHARTLLGAPYLWGGMSAAGIDCSGLVHMSFRACGRLVPRDADQQEEFGEPVAEEELRPGDLLTYGGPDAADHIAFWLGGGRILHSTQRDGCDGVIEEDEPPDLRGRCRAAVRFAARSSSAAN
jgi:gamma-D-glutamyl-L-lysine dipeptidyl-peptidase